MSNFALFLYSLQGLPSTMLLLILVLHLAMPIPGRSWNFWTAKETEDDSFSWYYSSKTVGERLDEHIRTIDRHLDKHIGTLGTWVDQHVWSLNKWVQEHMGTPDKWVDEHTEDLLGWLDEHIGALDKWLDRYVWTLNEWHEEYVEAFDKRLDEHVQDRCQKDHTANMVMWLDHNNRTLYKWLDENVMILYKLLEEYNGTTDKSLVEYAEVQVKLLENHVKVLEEVLHQSLTATNNWLERHARAKEEPSGKYVQWLQSTYLQGQESEEAQEVGPEDKYITAIRNWLGKYVGAMKKWLQENFGDQYQKSLM
ncbi:uncharacterized protein LOC135973301 [Chrysemys picta bellii]|uniref:uncharacterized protein LOC135973301 n=1 Tax=Chrysemys picta bellii TaxID=8478 RepID=UPI0032B2B77B